MAKFCINFAFAALLSLTGSASAFVVTPPPSSSSRGLRTQSGLSRPAPRTARVVRSQSMEGENLRPDVAQAMEEMANEAKETIDQLVNANKVMLFMKGNKMFPQCGFSNSAVQVLRACDVEFETFDVLTNPGVREGIKEYSSWPTIPQLYVDGEFTGGADIMIESFQSGELKKSFEDAGCKFVTEG